MRTFILIGGCQMMQLYHFLSFRNKNIKLIYLSLNDFAAYPDKQKSIIEYYNKLFEKKETIKLIQFNINKKYYPFIYTNLKEKYENVYTLYSFHMFGLFPDITYIYSDKILIRPLNCDYSSKICYESYCNGLSINECIKNFNYKTYEEKGYFLAYNKSLNYTMENDKYCDITFGKEFSNYCNEFQTMYSINHTTGLLMNKYIDKIMNFFDEKIIDYPITLWSDPLGNNNWNPIYHEIAEYNNIKFKYNPHFKIWDKFYTISEYVEGAYSSYSQYTNNGILNNLNRG